MPADFSKISDKALDYAVPLAKQFGAKITLLHAIEPLPYPMDLTYVPMGGGFPVGPGEERAQCAGEKDDRARTPKGVIVEVGTAFEIIANVARDCEADLIVIMTHGHTYLKLGSWAARPDGSCATLHDPVLRGPNARSRSGVKTRHGARSKHARYGISLAPIDPLYLKATTAVELVGSQTRAFSRHESTTWRGKAFAS